jgi:hypothetical protein
MDFGASPGKVMEPVVGVVKFTETGPTLPAVAAAR